MLSKLRSLLVCATALLSVASSAQKTINVPLDQPTIQAGINAANNGDTVQVAPGTYYENIDFKGEYISLVSSAGAATTIIDGSRNNAPAVTIAPGPNPLPGTGAPILLQGFTIQYGGTEPSAAPTGGIYINQMLPTVTLNILTHNHCAGIWIAETQGLIRNAPLILSNEIDTTLDSNGDCPIGGGSAIVVTGDLPDLQVGSSGIIDNLIQNNIQGGQEGSGASGISVLSGSLVIQNNTLRNNVTANAGGAIYLAVTAAPVIQNLIYDNQAACGGGAIAIYRGNIYPGDTLLIDSNTFLDNTVSGKTCVSSISHANSSQIFLDDTFSDLYGTLFANNIFSGSTSQPAIACSPIDVANGYVDLPVFDHNILYNSAGPVFDPVTCADQSTLYGNQTSDPQFVSSLDFDFHLKPSSPAIDAGQTSLISSEQTYADAPIETGLDIGGQARVTDGKGKGYAIVDMGAYEYDGVQNTEATSLEVTNSLDNQLVIPAAAGALVNFSAQADSQAYPPPQCDGSVQFFEDGETIGTSKLSNSTALLSDFFLTPGTHYIDAAYSGQSPCTAALSTPHVFLVDPYIAALTLVTSNSPSIFGQPVTFTATITSLDPNQGGPLYLTDESGTIPLATLVPVNGKASFTTSTLSIGSHGILVDYRGDSTHYGADAGVAQTVNGYASASTLTCNPGTIDIGSTSLLSVLVTSAGGTPTGSITFTVGTATLGQAALANGAATYTYTATSAGTFIITATYFPTGSFAASSSTCSIAVNGLPTTDTLTVSPTSGTASTNFLATAVIQPMSPGSPPTGTVTFSITIPPSTIPQPQKPNQLTAAGASRLLTTITPPFTVGCTYSGDATYAPGTCNTVNVSLAARLPTTTTIAITPTTSTYGQLVAFSTHVAPTTSTKLIPTGQVVLTCGSEQITLTLDAAGNGSTSTRIPEPVGSCPFTGQYSGDPNFAPSTSASLTYRVVAAPSTTVVTASPSPAYISQPVTFTIQVTGISSPSTPVVGSPVPLGPLQFGGIVQLFDGTSSIASGPVTVTSPSTAQAVFTTSTLTAGSHTITATYSNDSNIAPSTSAPITELILAADFALAGPASITFRTESTGTGTLILGSLYGFSGPIALTCNPPLPFNYLCTLSPSTATLPANGGAYSNIKLQPDLRSSLTPPTFTSTPRILLATLFPLALLAFARRRRNRFTTLLSLTLMTMVTTALTACGPDIFYAATPPGTYPITVTATGTAVGTSAPITHTLPLNVIITP